MPLNGSLYKMAACGPRRLLTALEPKSRWKFLLHGSLSLYLVHVALPYPVHLIRASGGHGGRAWPLCIFTVDWKRPESTCPCGEGEGCRVRAVTIRSPCAHGWPLVDIQFHSWHLHTTHSALRERRDRQALAGIWGEKVALALTDIWSSGEKNGKLPFQ